MSSALYTRVIIDVDEAAIIQAIKIESPVATPHFVSRQDGARYYNTILKGRETAGVGEIGKEMWTLTLFDEFDKRVE